MNRVRRTFAKLAAILAVMSVTLSVASEQGRRHPKYYEGPTTHAVVDGAVHDNVEITVDLPFSEHVKNFGAPRDGKGLCVFASMTMDARWHNIRKLMDAIHKVQEGGGWPEKVDKVLKELAPEVKYVQYSGSDRKIIDKMLDQAMARNSPVCVTYGFGERYNMETIYHMVLLVHLDSKWAVILDNNFPGTYEWMDRDEFMRRFLHPSGQGWLYFFLEPTPPPIPAN